MGGGTGAAPAACTRVCDPAEADRRRDRRRCAHRARTSTSAGVPTHPETSLTLWLQLRFLSGCRPHNANTPGAREGFGVRSPAPARPHAASRAPSRQPAVRSGAMLQAMLATATIARGVPSRRCSRSMPSLLHWLLARLLACTLLPPRAHRPHPAAPPARVAPPPSRACRRRRRHRRREVARTAKRRKHAPPRAMSGEPAYSNPYGNALPGSTAEFLGLDKMMQRERAEKIAQAKVREAARAGESSVPSGRRCESAAECLEHRRPAALAALAALSIGQEKRRGGRGVAQRAPR